MPARRFFIGGVHEPGDTVEVAGPDARKIRAVLRLKEGDALELIDSAGSIFASDIVDARDGVRAQLRERVASPERERLCIDVAQGIPKGQKMDFVIEKVSELGVRRIVPLLSQRVQGAPGDGKIERWRRIAKSAAEQCGRHDIAEVAEPVRFDALLSTFGEYDAVLFPWEVASGAQPLRELLPALIDGTHRILVVIGPEGGFSHEEAEGAARAGARVVSLGSRILRTETAALVLIAIVQYIAE